MSLSIHCASLRHCFVPIFFMIVLSGVLVNCSSVASTGAGAVYNRHSIQKNLADQYTTMQVYQALYFKTNEFKNTNIAIATYNGELLLAGQVPQNWQKTKAEEIVKQLDSVGTVYNLITVENPSSSLTKISDTWITTKVKAKLLASDDVDASKVKVITENGTVYLMGILQNSEADAAVELASTTDGVQKVVKIFSYMTISKKRLA